jgi:hypothetical protein
MGKLREWKLPQYYSGARWDGYLVAPCTRNRDSDTVERSNWDAQLERIPADGEGVTIVRENHWAVGWVEWLAILPTASVAVAEAEKIADELESYPILDEDAWSELEFEENPEDEDEDEDEDEE